MHHVVTVGCDKLAGVLLPARTIMTASAGTPQCGWPRYFCGPVHSLVCRRLPSVSREATVFRASLSHPTETLSELRTVIWQSLRSVYQ